MRKVLLLALTICLYTSATAQVYFVYMESEYKTPFYVRFNDKVYSSANTGYVLVTDLANGNYSFFISHAATPKEFKFDISIAADHGYMVKEKEGLLLSDIPGTNIQGKTPTDVTYEVKTDAFTLLLAKAAGDPTLMFETPKTKEKKTIEKEQEVTGITNAFSSEVLKTTKDTLAKTTQKESGISKYVQDTTNDGLNLIYVDKSRETEDTIRLTIPNKKALLKQKDTLSITTKTKTVIKPKCSSQASDKHVIKLQKNMATKTTDEAMVAEAQKGFENKCYTTKQIKYLSTLFLTSAGKYIFFETVYNHVSDPQQFHILQNEIKDGYYLERFKALIREQ